MVSKIGLIMVHGFNEGHTLNNTQGCPYRSKLTVNNKAEILQMIFSSWFSNAEQNATEKVPEKGLKWWKSSLVQAGGGLALNKW